MRFLLCYLICLFGAPAQALSSFSTLPEYISLSRNDYFSAFNHQDPEVVAEAAALEKEMVVNADFIMQWAQENPGAVNAEAGMYLVYASMLVLDRNNAMLEAPDFEKTKSIIEPLVVSRYEKSQKYLDQGLKLAPEDDRIESWNIANALRLEKHKTGTVSEKTLNKVMELANKSPIFHLFNALTMASDTQFGPEREDNLLKLSERMAGKESPCWPPIFRKGEAKKCKTTSKTPFAMQGVTTYLGDSFLKRAFLVAESNPEEAKTYFEKAQKMYKRLKFFLFSRKTKRWDQKSNLEARIEMIDEMKKTDKFQSKPEFLKSRQYLDIYTCYSCHQNGHSKRMLYVDLPAAKKLGE